MRRVVVISYTEMGREWNSRVVEYLTQNGDVPVPFQYRSDFMSTDEVLRQEWNRSSAFVFVGAMGIAVRHIARYLMDKGQDPAVLVADERGEFVIPVLSGHIGGGVALARELAEKLGARPVITTATDVEARFAVDVFARDNHLRIVSRERIKTISAALLRGERVDWWSGLPMAGEAPKGVCPCSFDACRKNACAVLLGLSSEEESRVAEQYGQDNTCILRPGRYILGIGCKKGKTADELEAFLDEVCGREGIDKREIAAIASVDRKREESGIWELSRRLCVPFAAFTAEELARVEEKVAPSEFVRQTLGVDNVCERSAYCLARDWTCVSYSGDTKGWPEEADAPSAGADFRVRWADAKYRPAVQKQAAAGMTLALVELVWK